MNDKLLKYYSKKGHRLNPTLVKTIDNIINKIAIREIKLHGILVLNQPRFYGIELIMLRNKHKKYNHNISLIIGGDIVIPKKTYIKPQILKEFKETNTILRYVNK